MTRYTKTTPDGRDWFDVLLDYADMMIETVNRNYDNDIQSGYRVPDSVIASDLREIETVRRRFNGLLSMLATLPAETRSLQSFCYLRKVGAI